MGRTLDTLKHGDGARPGLPGPRLAPAPGPVEDCVVEWTLGDEDVPFIEVGGPGKAVELSPGLVHRHPPQAKQPPHPPVVEKTRAGPRLALAVNLTEARPMAVGFEPWPAAPPGLPPVAPEVVAYHQPDHPISKDYAALLDRILHGLAGPAAPALLLAGLKPHVGATTVLLNLAVTAARAGARRVAVLDAHWARPGLAPRLGHAAPAGVQEVVSGTLALQQALVRTAVPTLSLLPASVLGKTSGPLTGEAVAWLLGWLRERHDLVLLDGPALDDPADVALLAPHCDATYLVLPQGESPQAARGPAQALIRLGARLRGLIHTHFEV